MPRRRDIKNNLTNELISLQIYREPLRPGDFNQEFEKWATIEVPNFETVPNEMETLTLQDGLYVYSGEAF